MRARGSTVSRAPAFSGKPMSESSTSLSWGLVDGRPVFMDADDDSYFTLEPDDEAAFLADGNVTLPTASRKAASALGVDRPMAIRSYPQPQESVLSLSHADERPSVRDVLLAWRLVAAARRSIRRRPIADLLARVERGTGAGRAPMALARAAARFAAARRFVPIQRNCLTDSIALLLWLERRGEGASFVFGVKLNPFGAHCWVQSDQLLLNDHLEHVERFTPVRAIQCAPDLQ